MTIVAAPIVIAILWFGRDFLIPLVITGLLYILFSALVDQIRGIRVFGQALPGWMAPILSAAIVIGAVLLFWIVLSASTENVQASLQKYEERLSNLGVQAEAFLGPKAIETIENTIATIDLGALVASVAGQFSGTFMMLVLVALYLFFLASEQAAWTEKLPRLAATAVGADRSAKALHRISSGVKQYMWVNAVTSAMSGLVAFAIFTWVGLDFAGILALIVFVVGFIPNIGAFIGITLPSLVALLQFDTLTPFFIVLIGYGLSDQIISNVLQPAMQGRSLNLSTFMIMVSLTFWATIWGGIGAFLAVPMMVVTMAVCAEFSAIRWIAVLLSKDGMIDGDHSETAGDY
jgi:predicted PurR-regulated permease PerM